MEVSKTRNFKLAYLINERKLRELDSIIKEVSDEIEYEVSCIDGTSIKFTTLEDLINYPNRKEKQYKEIEVRTSYRSSRPVRIHVNFMSYQYADSIRFRISGDERNVDYQAGRIEGFINSLKQWYSFLAVNNIISTFIVVFIAQLIPVAIMYSLGILNKFHSLWWIGFITAMIAIFVYDKVKVYLFPISAFELGDGIDRIKNLNFVRNLILVGIFLTIVLTYLVNQIPNIGENFLTK
ncbi:hypothetical protein V7122_07470 [Bacillus sp. JJ1532]|uniref:hypothetical protein n=1 Tax=Bacillus sp. JJ1532 TaxID=3122958 RepID=UPI002FFE7354